MLNNYELREKLDEAGFPFDVDKDLSELIEACQYENICILNDKGHDWQVYINNKSNVEDIYYGSTPEEAVARLWLALNKK